MIQLFLFMTILSGFLNAVELYDEDETTTTEQSRTYNDDPVTNLTHFDIQALQRPNINCENFANYALNCTVNAALMYNSSRKAPPMPSKITDWCEAIKYLTECAQDWNLDCRDVTDSRFNDESIQGHIHVEKNICDNPDFLVKYDELPDCIESVADKWEICYNTFKVTVDGQKNSTREWTHYETHFLLCCARSHFRRCTLNSLLKSFKNCSHQEVLTLQKFSIIVSEGDVFQNCDHNVMYTNCPGGDPRPSGTELIAFSDTNVLRSSGESLQKLWTWWFLTVYYFRLIIRSLENTRNIEMRHKGKPISKT